MPTDTPAAAPSQMAREIADTVCYALCRDDEQFKRIAVAAIDAKLAPVREAMEFLIYAAGPDDIFKSRKQGRELLASLSPQPPEAKR